MVKQITLTVATLLISLALIERPVVTSATAAMDERVPGKSSGYIGLSIETPVFARIRLPEPVELILDADRTRSISTAASVVSRRASEHPGRLVTLLIENGPLTFAGLPVQEQYRLIDLIGDDAPERYESAVADFLNHVLIAARNLGAGALSAQGLPIESGRVDASESNERYQAVIDQLDAFLSSRSVILVNSALDEAKTLREALPNAFQASGGRPVIYRANGAWRISLPGSDLPGSVFDSGRWRNDGRTAQAHEQLSTPSNVPAPTSPLAKRASERSSDLSNSSVSTASGGSPNTAANGRSVTASGAGNGGTSRGDQGRRHQPAATAPAADRPFWDLGREILAPSDLPFTSSTPTEPKSSGFPGNEGEGGGERSDGHRRNGASLKQAGGTATMEPESNQGEPSASGPGRFVVWINCFGGQHHLGPDRGVLNGVGKWWRGDDAVTNLIARLEDARQFATEIGEPTITVILNMPMGGGPQSGHVTGAAVDTIPAYKRALIKQQLKPYLASHPDVNLKVFIGSSFETMSSSKGYSAARNGQPFPGTAKTFGTDRAAWEYVRDWWKDVGATGFVIDYGSGMANRDWVVDLNMEDPNFTVWGEAIVRGENIANHRQNCVWIAEPRYMRLPSRGLVDYVVQPGETLGVILTGDPAGTDYTDIGVDYYERGWFILGRPNQLRPIVQALNLGSGS